MLVYFLSIDYGWTSRIQFKWNSEIMFFTLVCAELGQFLVHLKPVWVSIDSLIQKYADLKLLSKARMLLKQTKLFGIKKIIPKFKQNLKQTKHLHITAVSNFLRSICRWSLQLHFVLTNTSICKAYSLDLSDWFMRCWFISATYCMLHDHKIIN